MRLSQLFVVTLSLSATGWAQSSEVLADPEVPASSQAQQPATSPAEVPASSAAGPVEPSNTGSAQILPVPSTSRPNAQEPSAVATEAVPGSIQGGPRTGAESLTAVTTGTETAQLGSPQATAVGGSGNDTRSAGAAGSAAGGAGIATASPSSPDLATTASFAAQPSDGFTSVDESSAEKMPESDVATPPDAPTIDQFRAELDANIPSQAMTEKNAKALAIMETAYFEYFVNNAPAPVDMGRVSIPSNVSACQNTYARRLARRKGFVDGVLDWVPLASRDLRGFDNCKSVDSLELESRVKAQVDALNEALGAVKINFRFMSLNWWEPKANEDWSTTVKRRESKLQEWQGRTRAPGKLTLTVWIVNALRGTDDDDLNSYATFPNENLDVHDGIVVEAEHVQGNSTTLVHDVGHWFGLGHTFGAIGEQCLIQDGLTNATATSGNRDVVYACAQVPCAGGSAVEINNYMSYSACRGKTPRDGFTTDQKARMFANALQFRRGYGKGECAPDGKAAVKKRSSMQDLLDGQCPDYEKQASILVNTPHSRGSGLTGLVSGLKVFVGVAAAVFFR
ncbi:Extracellular metalloprotease [Colletotrichum orbiculare MAFF 240422]|uniref:Extracellular metalloprotease n=1 Tax=Colletotrichum orbiculare (strain 104-T / ATCC 96160 / CBS 514.97 / LARS 414 / MAFF 240422) TaxID=1213857 RepID=A0A484FGM9_COLOR|nr:Extracellular metalloprotease [Colletotrichum orbiculare MAFF 240422]